MIRNSKILLNIHNTGVSNFEFVRIVPAICAGGFVISENSANEEDFSFLKAGLVLAEYDELVQQVEYYLFHEAERLQIQQKGVELVKAHPFGLL